MFSLFSLCGFLDQRCGSGALRTPLLSERTKNHQGRSADRRLQFEYHAADAQEGKVTVFEYSSFSVLSWRRHGNEPEYCPDVNGSAGVHVLAMTACCLCLLLESVPVIRLCSHTPHMLVPRAWLLVCVYKSILEDF